MYRLLLVLLLIAAAFLEVRIAEFFFGYIPWPSERKAQEIALGDVKQLLAQLPLIIDMVPMRYRGEGSEEIHYSGNFKEKSATVDADFVTDIPAGTACFKLQSYFGSIGWDTRTFNPPCEVRNIRETVFTAMNARKTFGWDSSESFSVRIEATEYADESMRKHIQGRTKVRVILFRTLDQARDSACSKEVPPDEQPCRNANWGAHLL